MFPIKNDNGKNFNEFSKYQLVTHMATCKPHNLLNKCDETFLQSPKDTNVCLKTFH